MANSSSVIFVTGLPYVSLGWTINLLLSPALTPSVFSTSAYDLSGSTGPLHNQYS